MFAVVKTGGKQFKVSVGQTIAVEKLPFDAGSVVRLDEVLLASNGTDIAYGRPTIDGAVVTAEIKRQYRGPKLTIFRYKSKSRYRRKTGHRQDMTQLLVDSIEIPGWMPVKREVWVASEHPVVLSDVEETVVTPVIASEPVSLAEEVAPPVKAQEGEE